MSMPGEGKIVGDWRQKIFKRDVEVVGFIFPTLPHNIMQHRKLNAPE